VAAESGILLLGPNCLGLTNYDDATPLALEPSEPFVMSGDRRIGIVAQSGAMANNIRDALVGRGLPIAYSVSTGNEADLSIEDFLETYISGSRVSAIALYAEQIRYPQRFLELADAARAKAKPIVLLMPGRSEGARKAAQSHTGALAADHALVRTLLERRGVICVDGMDELFDVIALVRRYPTPSAKGAAFLTHSGALKNVALDIAADVELPLPALSQATVQKLHDLLPEYAAVENPLDYTTVQIGDPGIVAKLARAMADDPNIGAVIAATLIGGREPQKVRAQYLVPALGALDKVAVFAMLGDELDMIDEVRDAVVAHDVVMFRSMERALHAVARVRHYATKLQIATGSQESLPVGPPPPGSGPIAEHIGKSWLQSYGLRAPRGGLAKSAAQAVAIAEDIGFPVVLKAQAAQLMHKSDVGGVKVGLRDADAVRESFQTIVGNVAKHKPGLTLDGVLVEEMAAKGVEMVVGAKRDPQWGAVVLVGLGGVWIEVLKDVRLLDAESSRAEIRHEIGRLRAAALLRGVRGEPGVDIDAVVDAVWRIASLMRAFPQISEIDVNPLVAMPDHAVMLDALIICAAGEGDHAG
jgi:acyl-CoA synthetase (NDP forming)